jgi:hypothetical protein
MLGRVWSFAEQAATQWSTYSNESRITGCGNQAVAFSTEPGAKLLSAVPGLTWPL